MFVRVMALHFDAVLGGFDDTPLREFLKDKEVAEQVRELRKHIAESTRLTPLVDSLEIEIPRDVDFANWDQLSSYLRSREA